jgi:hypothetical protein
MARARGGGSAPQYTTEDVLTALREYHAQQGRWPTYDQWNADHRRPSTDVMRHRFGSWSAALAAARVGPADRRTDANGHYLAKRVKVERSIWQRYTADGTPRFEVQLRVGDRMVRETHDSLDEARDRLAAIRRAKREGTVALLLAPRHGLTFAVASDAWYDDEVVKLSANTRESYRIALRSHLYEPFGDRLLEAITPEHLADFIKAQEAQGAAPWSIKQRLGVLGRVFRYAARHLGYRGQIPTTLLDPDEKPAPEQPDEILTPEVSMSLLADFLQQHCIVGPEHEVAAEALRASWTEWLHASGHGGWTDVKLARHLRAAMRGQPFDAVRRGGRRGERRIYRGIGLTEDAVRANRHSSPAPGGTEDLALTARQHVAAAADAINHEENEMDSNGRATLAEVEHMANAEGDALSLAERITELVERQDYPVALMEVARRLDLRADDLLDVLGELRKHEIYCHEHKLGTDQQWAAEARTSGETADELEALLNAAEHKLLRFDLPEDPDRIEARLEARLAMREAGKTLRRARLVLDAYESTPIHNADDEGTDQ